MLRRLAPVVLVALLLAQFPGVAVAVGELRPDLGMAPLTDLRVTTIDSGQRQLRFSATIVNVGQGPFEITATRSSQDAPFQVVQQVPLADGTRTPVTLPVGLVYGGDGHDHWHVRDLESYQIVRQDHEDTVGVSAKGGFCFYDTSAYRRSLPGAARSTVYPKSGCGKRDSLVVSMGLSVGWADIYAWTLPDQFIDITNLADGRYRLVATADAQGMFVEGSRANNSTWVDIALVSYQNGTAVRILGHGPSA